MKKIVFLFSLLTIFVLTPPSVFADSPTLLAPPDNAVLQTKPKLTWAKFSECESTSCYKVEISAKEDLSEPEKTAYTNGVVDPTNPRVLSYSPNLTEGNWYWHVKGKNNDGSWGDFSETRVFTIGTPTEKVLGATSSKQEFEISIASNKLIDLEPLAIKVSAKNLEPNTKYFLKGAFYKESSTNYFGLTQNNSTWTKNSAPFDAQPNFTTDSTGVWQGEINVRNDPSDSGYPGTGDYQLKVARYNEKGDGPSWSNSLSVYLNARKMTATSLGSNPTPQPVAENTLQQNSPAPVLGAQTEQQLTPLSKGSDANIDYKLPDISGGTSQEGPIPPIDQKVLVAGQKTTNWWFISSGSILFALGAFHYWRSKKKSFRIAT